MKSNYNFLSFHNSSGFQPAFSYLKRRKMLIKPNPMQVQTLFSFIHDQIFGQELMAQAQLIDTNANGIQIQGKEEVDKVAVGVSCNAEFLEKAIDWGAQVCIFHHGLSISEKYSIYNSRLLPSLQKQLKLIFENNLTIAGYHFCLDTDPNIGNNVLIAGKLAAKLTGEKYFDDWGVIAEFDQSKDLQDIAKDCSNLFHHDVFIIKAKENIKRFGICSGGAIPRGAQNFDIIAKNLDLHITGEIKEGLESIARENNFSYLACGHYATETIGIQALGEKINEQFAELDVRFIEVWNEL